MRARVLTAALAVALVATVPATAAVVININQSGSRVVANAFGSLNLIGLTRSASIFPGAGPRVNAGGGQIVFNTGPSGQYYQYFSITGTSFGTGGNVFATTSSGTPLSLTAQTGVLFAETTFGWGGSVRSRNIWNNASLASLGMTPGTYTYTLPNDLVTLNIGGGAVVPEPASWTLLLIGFGLSGAMIRRANTVIGRAG